MTQKTGQNERKCYYSHVMDTETGQTGDFATLYRRAFKNQGV
jgi:hypothetical protein